MIKKIFFPVLTLALLSFNCNAQINKDKELLPPNKQSFTKGYDVVITSDEPTVFKMVVNDSMIKTINTPYAFKNTGVNKYLLLKEENSNYLHIEAKNSTSNLKGKALFP